MKIAAAQIRSVAGDIGKNIEKHLELVAVAVEQRADLIFFPELSLTGYEPTLARELATHQDDPRLDVFQKQSDAHNLIISVGMPLLSDVGVQDAGVRIGMILFLPEQSRVSYAKQLLHSDELSFFVPGHEQLTLNLPGHTLAPAICFESLQASHSNDAARAGADIYLASVAKSAIGLGKAYSHFPTIAKQHMMTVLMANSVGPSDNFVSAGQSAIWSNRGELVGQLDSQQEGIVMINAETNQATVTGV